MIDSLYLFIFFNLFTYSSYLNTNTENQKNLISKEITSIEIPVPISSSVSESSTPGNGIIQVFSMPKDINCFKNSKESDIIQLENLSSQINFSRAVSAKELESVLNVSAGAEVSYGIFSASANANYLKEASDSRYSENFSYVQTYSANAKYMVPDLYGNDLLNNIGRGALANGRFTEVCGDGFISSSKAGAVLITTVSIEFGSAKDKTEFDAQIKGGIKGIASLTAAFKKTLSTSEMSATLSVKAIQNGGDPSKLANVFGKPLEGGSFAISKCGKDDIDSCSRIIDGIIAYAQDDFQKGLDIKNPSSVYYYNPVVERYSTYGVNYDYVNISPEIREQISYLINRVQTDLENKQYLLKYISYLRANPEIYQYVPVDFIGDINLLIRNYDKILDLNSNVISNCFNADVNEKCSEFVQKIKQEHQEFDQKYLKKVYALKTIIIAGSKYIGTKYLFLPINIDNNVPVVDLEFGANPLEKGISGDYLIKMDHHYAQATGRCKVNYNPSVSGIKVWRYYSEHETEQHAGQHEPEIWCESVQAIYNYDGKRDVFSVTSSSKINRIGVVLFDESATAQDPNHIPIFQFIGGSSYDDIIGVIKMENMLEYNPI
jgi:hypothetical protein